MGSCRYSRHLGRLSAEENKEEAVSTAPAERSDEEEEAEDDDKDVFDMSTLSSRAKIANMRAPPPELLSEQWKEDEESDSSALVAAAAGVFLAVAFIAVAGQVPVGDDLSSFSYNKGDRDLLTPDQVKAKYAAVLESETEMLTSLVAFASETLERVGGGPSYAYRLASGSLRSGYLFGQSGRTGLWEKRFFVLRPTTLLYYFGSQADEEALGCLDVEAFSRVECSGPGDDGSVCVDLVREGARFRLKCTEDGEGWYNALKNETYAELKTTSEILRKQRDEFATEISRLEEALAVAREEASRNKSAAKQATARYSYLAGSVAALYGVDEIDDQLLSRVKAKAEVLARAADVQRKIANEAREAAEADKAAASAATFLLGQARNQRDEAEKLNVNLKSEKHTLRRALKRERRRQSRCQAAPSPLSQLPPPTMRTRVVEEVEDDESWRVEFKESLRDALVTALQEQPKTASKQLPASTAAQVEDTSVGEFVPPADDSLDAFLADGEADDDEDSDEGDEEEEGILRIEYRSPKIGISFSLNDSSLVVVGTTADYDPNLPAPPVGAKLVAINSEPLHPTDHEANAKTLKNAPRPLQLAFQLADTTFLNDEYSSDEDDGLTGPSGPSLSSMLLRESKAAASTLVPGILLKAAAAGSASRADESS